MNQQRSLKHLIFFYIYHFFLKFCQDGPCDVAGAWVRSGDYIPGTRDALGSLQFWPIQILISVLISVNVTW